MLTQKYQLFIIPGTMAIDDGRRPEFPRGSREWVETLNPRSNRHTVMITEEMRTAAMAVLGDSFSEAAWRGMFVSGESKHNAERQNSRTAPSMIALMQGFGWSTNHPEFQYVSAQLHIRLGEQVRVPGGRTPVDVFRLEEVDGRKVRVFVRRDEPPKPADVKAMRQQIAAFADEHGISPDRQAALEAVARFPLLNYTKRQRPMEKLRERDTQGFIEAMSA